MFILLVTFAVLSSAAKTAWHKLDESYSFEKFIKEHNIRFKNEDDKQMRQGLFTNELKRVLNHNKKNLSWKEGMNMFKTSARCHHTFMAGGNNLQPCISVV